MGRRRNKQQKKIRTGIADYCKFMKELENKASPDCLVSIESVVDVLDFGKELLLLQDTWINDLTTNLSKSERKYNAVKEMVDFCAEKNSGLRHRITRLEKLVADLKAKAHACDKGDCRVEEETEADVDVC